MLINFLRPPEFADDPEKSWKASLLNAFTIITFGFSFAIILAHQFAGELNEFIVFLNVVVIIASIISFVILRKGFINSSAVFLLIIGFVTVTFGIYLAGTILSAISSIYLFIIVVATLLFGRIGLVITSVLSSIIIFAMTYSFKFGLLPIHNIEMELDHWIVLTLLFGVTGLVANYAQKATKSNLEQLIKEEKERKKYAKTLLNSLEKLKESEARYKAVSELTSDYSFAFNVDADGKLENDWVAGALIPLSQYSQKELKDLGGWGKIVHQDDFELLKGQFSTLLSNKPNTISYRIIKKDGSVSWVRDNARPVWCNIKKRVIKIEGAIQDITESKLLNKDLIEAKNKAEESDRLKTAFLANMSHEIRTPLNGILGFAQILQDTDISPDETQQFLQIIQKSGRNMLQTINDIIDISKVEAGLMEINKIHHNINETLQYLFEFFSPEANAKGFEFNLLIDNPDKKCVIHVDQFKLNEILTNLIKNALKYTFEGSISFGYKRKEKKIEFFIKDTGIGVPKEKQKSIFNRFEQADVDVAHVADGSGLGLSITLAYVKMHNGELWLESEPNKGSTFYFSLPY